MTRRVGTAVAARRLDPGELPALPPSRRHNGGPPLDDPPARILRLARPALAAPALIVKRTPLYYRGRWNGPDDYHGRLLVEGRAGAREWVDIQALLDGGWDGQPVTTAMLSHVIGMWGAAGLVIPGSQTWTASGTHSVARFNRLEVAVWGGGGKGGAGGSSSNGSTGNASSYVSSTPVAANGGNGGNASGNSGTGGSGGTASGGDTNTTGAAGNSRLTGTAGKGGNAPSSTGTLLGTLTGGTGGASPGNSSPGDPGNTPGGGGSGGDDGINSACAGGGGSGGFALKLWSGPGASGAPAVDASITTTVGGTQSGGGSGNQDGGNGARGEIRAQWD